MIYKTLVRPWLFRMDPEDAHVRVIRKLAKWRLGASLTETFLGVNDHRLQVKTLGLKFYNPVGLAAGLDKHGEASAAWQCFGFGFFEIGTVTPRPQEGNPRPRIFRLPKDRALINRLGFNSVGADVVRNNLLQSPRPPIPRGINVGRNWNTPNEDAVKDYLSAMETLQEFADYFVINISSPNTKGLRDLQHPVMVRNLVEAAVGLARSLSKSTPVLVKVAPDFEDRDLEETINAVLEGGAAGFVATNTTVSRDGLTASDIQHEAGGISGVPLRKRTVQVVRKIFRCTDGTVPIIGVGGISGPEDAFEMISAGASLVQTYTGFVYEGPGLVRKINQGLLKLLHQKNLSSIEEAVGRDCT